MSNNPQGVLEIGESPLSGAVRTEGLDQMGLEMLATALNTVSGVNAVVDENKPQVNLTATTIDGLKPVRDNLMFVIKAQVEYNNAL